MTGSASRGKLTTHSGVKVPLARRALLAGLLAAVVLALSAGGAEAHPLGNFSVNHLSMVSVSADRVDVRYVLDQAEIPTVQERGVPRARLRERKLAEVERGLGLTVDGRPTALRTAGVPRLSFPAGAGGLETTRLEVRFTAAVSDPGRVSLRDDSFADRVGWKAIISAPGEGTAVRTEAPSGDPTNGLRRYPEGLLDSPLDRREASFAVSPGDGTLAAPRSEGSEQVSTSRTGGDGFAAIFEQAASGEGVLFVLLLAAFGWGALHALSPGHGKAMVAAYLVGTRGKPRHAVALGATVTVAHTIGVFLLGFVTLALSQYVLPEDLYPWLNLVSGLLVVVIGAGVLRSRVRWARARRAAAATGTALPTDRGPSADAGHGHHHAHEHGHRHGHRHPHAHAHEHGHRHAHEHRHSLSRAGLQHFLDHLRGREHGHGHRHGQSHSHDHHAHAGDDTVTKRSLIGLGAAAGLIPCPSALVVLLGAIAQHEVALGLLLIVAFSLGLAGTLTGLGLAVVYARRLLPRLGSVQLGGTGGLRRVAAALPAASALVIVGVGCLLTANALPAIV
jgi:nickel/cobalt transporter (NicO) family protein